MKLKISTSSSKRKSGTIIHKCDCDNPQQDDIYGKQTRVMNICKAGDEAKCTSCSKSIKI